MDDLDLKLKKAEDKLKQLRIQKRLATNKESKKLNAEILNLSDKYIKYNKITKKEFIDKLNVFLNNG